MDQSLAAHDRTGDRAQAPVAAIYNDDLFCVCVVLRLDEGFVPSELCHEGSFSGLYRRSCWFAVMLNCLIFSGKCLPQTPERLTTVGVGNGIKTGAVARIRTY